MRTRLRLLGSVGVLVDDLWRTLPPHKTSCLLAFLGFEGDWVLRERAAYLFWPDSDEADSRRNLRQLLSRLRSISWLQDLEIEKQRLRWLVDTDVADFRVAIGSKDWSAAIEAYGGDLGQGLATTEVPAFEAWLALERDALQGAWRNALTSHAAQLMEVGEYLEAGYRLERLLDTDPLAEDVLQQYLRCAAAARRRQRALRVYERFARTLQRELGLEPLPETAALADSLRTAPSPPPVVPAKSPPKAPAALTKPPSTVGRDALIELALSSDEPLVWVSGEPGIGKSRLLGDLAPGAPVVHCHEGLQSVPFAPVPTLVKTLAGSGVDLGSLGGYLEDLVRLVPDLDLSLRPRSEDPQVGRARLLEALSRLLEQSLDREHRFQLVFEDLQWADDATLELLTFLVSDERVRCLASYRSNEISPSLERVIGSPVRARTLTLEPLDVQQIRTLLADLMGAQEGPTLFGNWLHRQSGGNPMFALETLATLFETGDLEVDGANWHSRLDDVTRDYRELVVPAAIHEVVARRLSRLSPEALRIVQALAVVAAPLDARLLGRISGLSDWAALEAVEEGESAGLLVAGGFRHDIVRQVAYLDLPVERRRLLHRLVAKEGGPEADPAVLAEHWLAAGQADTAVEAWLAAARSFQQRGLHEDALTLHARAEENAPNETLRQRSEVARARVLVELGRVEEACTLARSVLAGTVQAAVRAQLLDVLVAEKLLEGQESRAWELVSEGVALARESGDLEVIKQLESRSATVAFLRGEYEEALELSLPYLEDARRSASGPADVSTLTNVATIYDNLGRQREALPLHLEAVDLARRVGARHSQVDATVNLMYCYMDLGEPQRAIDVAREALELGHFEGTEGLRANLAAACVELEEWQEAAEQYRHIAAASSDATLLCVSWSRLVDIELRLGDATASARALDRCLELATRVEGYTPRARAVITVLRHGSEEQVEMIRPVLAGLDTPSLPPYLGDELRECLRLRLPDVAERPTGEPA